MPWTNDEIKILKELYPHKQTMLIAKHLGKTYAEVFKEAYRHGLKKSESFLSSLDSGRLTKADQRGQNTRFKKGVVPWNKGKKGLQIGGTATQFKKGAEPHNTKFDGCISVRSNKRTGCRAPFIRLAKKNWVLLSRHIWEQTFGPIPKGMVVRFKDGNFNNHSIDNLELITRKENMLKNSLYRFPPELVETIHTLTQLKKLVKKHGKK